ERDLVQGSGGHWRVRPVDRDLVAGVCRVDRDAHMCAKTEACHLRLRHAIHEDGFDRAGAVDRQLGLKHIYRIAGIWLGRVDIADGLPRRRELAKDRSHPLAARQQLGRRTALPRVSRRLDRPSAFTGTGAIKTPLGAATGPPPALLAESP